MKDYYRKRAVIYGLGYEYKKQERFIKSEFDIVGYSDRNEYEIPLYVRPAGIAQLSFDYIYVTSHKLFAEIKQDILNVLKGKVDEEQIISFDDVWGDFRHIRHEWVVEKIGKISAGKILLDAGAGEQPYAPFCSHLKYIAQELFRTVEMSEKYCSFNLIQEQADILSQAVKIMSQLSLMDSISSETLCFGYLIEAYKR